MRLKIKCLRFLLEKKKISLKTCLLIVSGILIFLRRYLQFFINLEFKQDIQIWKNLDQMIILFIFLGFFVPIFFVVCLNSTLYNGWRQVYFINVFLIYFTSYGIFSLVKFKLFKKIKRWFFFLIGFLLVMIFYEIIKIHPYQSFKI